MHNCEQYLCFLEYVVVCIPCCVLLSARSVCAALLHALDAVPLLHYACVCIGRFLWGTMDGILASNILPAYLQWLESQGKGRKVFEKDFGSIEAVRALWGVSDLAEAAEGAAPGKKVQLGKTQA